MERTDVRARQAAWLTLVLPAAIVLTVAMAFVKIPAHEWPWVLAVLPATIGAAAGLIPLVSLLGPAPFPDRPGGNPLDGFSDESGDQVRLQTLIVLVLELLCAAPAAALVLAGRLLHNTAVQWLGLPTGLITGLFCAWLFGWLAYHRLSSQGPEILDIMRKGPQRDPVAAPAGGADGSPVPARQDLPSGIAAVVGALMTLGILSLFPQGIVALVLGSVHAKVHGWFLALHFSAPDRVLISTGFILAGLTMLGSAAAMVWTTRRRQRRAATVLSQLAESTLAA
jgi:ABC-2 type transport system permease protein